MTRPIRLRLLQFAFVLSWSSGWISAELVYPLASSGMVLITRFAGSAMLVGVWMAVRRLTIEQPDDFTRPRSSIAREAVAGVLSQAVWLWAVIEAQRFGLSPGANAILNAVQPLVAAAVMQFVRHTKLGGVFWIGLAIAFAGVVAVVIEEATIDGTSPWVFAFPVISVASMTIAVYVQDGSSDQAEDDDHNRRRPTPTPPRRRTRSPKLRSLLIQTTASTVAAGLLFLINPDTFAEWSWRLVALLGFTTLVPTLAAYALLWHLVEKTGPHRASTLFLASPPTTVLLSWLVLGSSVTVLQLIGTAAVLTGLYLANREKRARVG